LKLGISLPQTGASAHPGIVRDFAQMAESLGFDSLWVSDHVVFPRRGSGAHPSTVDHPVLTSEVPWLEAIATLSFVAACTTRPLLGTSVLVLPQRNPVIVAKQLASVDVLSEGRLVFGAGIGWWSEEFEALAAPFPNRGRRMDDYLEVVRQCWVEDHPQFAGRFYELGDVGFYPKPVRSSSGRTPPVWIGAYSSPGFQRAGRAGDGLFLSRTPPEEIPAAWAEARSAAAAAGRDPDQLTLTSFARLRWETDAEAEAAASRLKSLAAAGVQHIVLHFSGAGYRHPVDPQHPDMAVATRLVERFLAVVRVAAGV
jgi:probable F420-dependent oxidoreductase